MTRLRLATVLLAFVITMGGLLALSNGISYAPDDALAYQPTPTAIAMPASADVWHEILRPTEDCPLPCWWDITPGETTVDEAIEVLRNRFASFRLLGWQTTPYFYGNTTIPGIDLQEAGTTNEMLVISLATRSIDDEIIDALEFSMLYGPNEPEANEHIFEYFEVVDLVDVYGVPEHISVLTVNIEDQDKIFFIILYWEELGFSISYDFEFSIWYEESREGISPLSQPCFNIDALSTVRNSSAMQVTLLHPENDVDLSNLVYPPPIYGTPVFEATGLSNEEFTSLLLENDGCLPADLHVIGD